MIKVKGLKKQYGQFNALKGINIQVKQGIVYGFLGQNGAGKTTTINILTGLLDYQEGTVEINGMSLKKNRKEIMNSLGYLPESPQFYPYMNAYEYLSFIGKISGYDPSGVKKRTEELLEEVKLTEAAKRRVGGYSRGMKQRLGLAVALYNHPQLLFLDEPASALDPEGRRDVLDIIERLKEKDITVFLSTHILNDAERICDEVAILREGEITLTGSLEEITETYIQLVYDIEFEGLCEDFKNSLLVKPWVDWVEVKGNKMSVSVNNREIAKHQLLKEVSQSDNPVVSYSIRKSNLEDIFMRVVKNNEQF